ncbi:hypothetical protein SJAV_00270 [Sulfurisphaera javensis]|uniref:Uncharacterized protein n=1 Tax=Sulfurisphaera javensis TaxID=2049879 RepID=A0AAT9GMY5_9CREN
MEEKENEEKEDEEIFYTRCEEESEKEKETTQNRQNKMQSYNVNITSSSSLLNESRSVEKQEVKKEENTVKEERKKIITTSKEIHIDVVEPEFKSPSLITLDINSEIPKVTQIEVKPLEVPEPIFLLPSSVTLEIDPTIPKFSFNTEIKEFQLPEPKFFTPPQIPLQIESEILVNLNVSSPPPSSNSVQSLQPKREINGDLYFYLNNFLGFVNQLNGKFIVIVYDELQHPKIEESLSAIVTRFAEIRGYSFNPLKISKVNYRYSLQNAISKDGIYVLSNDLCELVNDKEFEEVFKSSIISFVGNKFTIVIMPKCLRDKYSMYIQGQPSTIIEEKFTLEEIKVLTYLASGFTIKNSYYDGLANVRTNYEKILNESWIWLRKNYINLDVPAERTAGSNESELHRKLKAVTIRHLIKNEKIDPNNIEVESVIFSGKIPDIYVRSTNTIYDAKASIGVLPSDELFDLMNKYSSITKRIYAVMEPLAVLLDLEGVIQRIKSAKQQGIELSVLIPVKKDERVMLVSIFDFLKEGKEFYKEEVTSKSNKNNSS